MIERGNWLLNPIEEWSQFLGGCNWYTFHPFMLEIEDDRVMGGVEATVIVLGLGFRWRWTYKITEELAGIIQQVSDLQSGKVKIEDLQELK